MKLNITRILKQYGIVLLGCAFILLPLLSPGYVMSFDMPWGPNFPAPTTPLNYSPLFALIDFFASFSGWLIQKIILVFIVGMTAFGAYAFMHTLQPKFHSLLYSFAALIYLYNPFFYARFVTGQWLVLVGFALLPWALRSVYLFSRNPHLKTALPVTAWFCAISFTSIHTIGIAGLAAISMLVFSSTYKWKSKLYYIGLIAALWCAINAIWLVPFINGESSASRDIATYSHSEMQAFATNDTILDSSPLSAALLTGFWADTTNRYILPSHLPIWWAGVAIIVSLVLLGIVQIVRQRIVLGYMFIGIGVVTWLLGIGVAWNVSEPLNDILTRLVPYYNGYREPHKWLMLLALVYTYIATIGAAWAYTQIRNQMSPLPTYGFVTILLISPLLFSPALAWGAAGQLKPVTYPQQWQDAKTYLKDHAHSRTSVLVLPWHMYQPISFVGRVVANPARYYFDEKMITGNNFELDGVLDQNNTPLTTYVTTKLTDGSSPPEVARRLTSYSVTYILLLKESDWKNYTWLNNQANIVPVVSNEKLILYKINGGTYE